MASVQKKVVIRTFAGVFHWGYLPPAQIRDQDRLSLMQVDGHLSSISINEIKTIAYVRDFNLDDTADPERLGRRSFLARPRGDGLWLRLTFRDDDQLEGLATFAIALIDSLIDDHGFFLTPPDARGNTQRLFIPRLALRSVEVLGYVTAPSKRRPPSPATDNQPSLFALTDPAASHNPPE